MSGLAGVVCLGGHAMFAVAEDLLFVAVFLGEDATAVFL